MTTPVSISVIGSGYVGLVAAACLAEMGHSVVCVDKDEERIRTLAAGGVPIFERHLPDVLALHHHRRLSFTTDLDAAVSASDAIFIAVDTPQGDNGAANLSCVEDVVSSIARNLGHGYKVIVEKSTVPVYTNGWIRRILARHGVESRAFDVVTNPEFLREGSAVTDFLHPDRLVVGSSSDRATRLMQRIYAPLTTGTYYARAHALPGPCTPDRPAPLLLTSPESAEIIKHASNAFLALKISFINSVANLAESVDADIEEIAAGIGMDHRIGPDFLRAGLGYGGSCFPKDVAAFQWTARQRGIEFELLSDISQINEAQKDRFFAKVLSVLWSLRGKRLAVLGLAYKGGTDDIRESPAVDLIRRLLDAGASVTAFDPAAMERAQAVLASSSQLQYASDAYSAARQADAILILTDWREFASLDLDRLASVARFPLVIDGRNLYKPSVMRNHGFTYVSIGRPAVPPAPQPKIQTVEMTSDMPLDAAGTC